MIESIDSEKLPQDQWEDNECDKFLHKWYDLQKEIKKLEEKVSTSDPAKAPYLMA